MKSWISSEDDSSKQRKSRRSRDTRGRTSGMANGIRGVNILSR